MKLYAIKVATDGPPELFLSAGAECQELDKARLFSTPGDASAWMQTKRIVRDLCEIVPVPPAAMREAEAAARAEWIGRGGRVAS